RPVDHRHLPSFPTRRSSDLGASATGTENDSVVESPVGSVTTTVPVCVPSSAKVCCGFCPVVVPPSSNDQSKVRPAVPQLLRLPPDRKSTRLNSSHRTISYAV